MCIMHYVYVPVYAYVRNSILSLIMLTQELSSAPINIEEVLSWEDTSLFLPPRMDFSTLDSSREL